MRLGFIDLTDLDAAWRQAERFLAARPVEHNFVATTLWQGAMYGVDGTCWLVIDRDREDIAGVGVQAPRGLRMVLTPMGPERAEELVSAMGAAGKELPGVIGEAATAAAFA